MAELFPPIPQPSERLLPRTPPDQQALADFKPNCPDCRYDLKDSPDGRCPECGLRFTHDGLKRQWVVRKRAKADRNRDFLRAGGIGFGILASGLIMVGSLPGFIAVVIFWTFVAGIWSWFNRDVMMAHSYYFLAYLLPIVVVMLVVAATPFGLYACVVLGVLGCAVGWLALRWSPLVSGILLLTFIVGPLLLIAAVMYSAASADLVAGRYWSSFDQPTPHGWTALPAPQSVSIARWLACAAGAIVLIVATFARRAFVRLKHRAGHVAAS